MAGSVARGLVARGLVVPKAQGDAVSVAEVVTVSVASVEAVALTEAVTVVVKEPATVLVSEPPPAPACAEPMATADGEEEPELVGLPVNVPLPVGDPGGGFDTVAVLLGVSFAEDVKLPDEEVERDAQAEGDSLAEKGTEPVMERDTVLQADAEGEELTEVVIVCVRDPGGERMAEDESDAAEEADAESAPSKLGEDARNADAAEEAVSVKVAVTVMVFVPVPEPSAVGLEEAVVCTLTDTVDETVADGDCLAEPEERALAVATAMVRQAE